jgi:hypothetical protein
MLVVVQVVEVTLEHKVSAVLEAVEVLLFFQQVYQELQTQVVAVQELRLISLLILVVGAVAV